MASRSPGGRGRGATGSAAGCRTSSRSRRAGGGGTTSVPVVAGGHHHGRIVAYSPAGALRDSDVGILERAATVAALVITKQQAVTAVESKYRADFLRDVLTGRAGRRERVVAQGQGVRLGPGAPGHRAGRRARPGGRRAHRPGPPGRRAGPPACAATTARGAVAGFSHEVVAVVGRRRATPAAVAKDAAAAFADVPPATFSTGAQPRRRRRGDAARGLRPGAQGGPGGPPAPRHGRGRPLRPARRLPAAVAW